MENLGVYIQIPFCASKCSFCNFSSRVVRAGVFEGYCRALEQEIERLPALYRARGMGGRVMGLAVDTLYLGGGTPPLVGANRLAGILNALRKRFAFASAVEFTLEITPGSGDNAFLDGARELGVSRLSIGAQSFSDLELRSVGRLHSAEDTRDLVRRARERGFAEVSLDLIAGLPYQDERSWRESLDSARRLDPEHISVYLFEIDEKSRLGGEVLRHGERFHATAIPDDDFMADAYETARQFLARAGYEQYEISNFALPGHASRHNKKYWQLEPYVGLGAGAHSFDGKHRWANVTAVETYQNKLARGDSPITEARALSRQELLEEFFFLGLRQNDGIDLQRARNGWGEAQIGPWESKISELAGAGLLERQADRVRLNGRACLLSNEVFQEFLAP